MRAHGQPPGEAPRQIYNPTGYGGFESHEATQNFLRDRKGGFTVCSTWEHVVELLAGPLQFARSRAAASPTRWETLSKASNRWSADYLQKNRFAHERASPEASAIVKETEDRVGALGRLCSSSSSTSSSDAKSGDALMATVAYCFRQLGSGVAVRIHGGQLELFVPFRNGSRDGGWRNTWSSEMHVDASQFETVGQYFRDQDERKAQARRRGGGGSSSGGTAKRLSDASRWKCVDGVVIDAVDRPAAEGARPSAVADTGGTATAEPHARLYHLQDMLLALCKAREVPDVEFVVNTQLHPGLRNDLTEPHVPLFWALPSGPPPSVHAADLAASPGGVAPLLSFVTGPGFVDVAIPGPVDWEVATGLAFPHGANVYTKKSGFMTRVLEMLVADVRASSSSATGPQPAASAAWWSSRVPTALWRGPSTGAGSTAETNQRLALAALANRWKLERAAAGTSSSSAASPPLLDAALTGWDERDVFSPVPTLNPEDPASAFPGTWSPATRGLTWTDPTATPLQLAAQSLPSAEPSPSPARLLDHKYAVSVPGTCADESMLPLLLSGCAIVRVGLPAHLRHSSESWFTPALRACGSLSSSSTEAAHVFEVRPDLLDLRSHLEFLRERDDVAREMGLRCQRLVRQLMLRDGILDYLQFLCVTVASSGSRRSD